MYLIRTSVNVPAGSSAKFEDDSVNLGKLRTGQPGYLGQTLLRSYSHPSQYQSITRWEDFEAAWRFTRSDAFTRFAQEHFSSGGRVTDQDAFESVFEVNADNLGQNPDPSQSSCEVLADWTLNQGAQTAAEFERNRKELFELRKRCAPGFVSARLRRAAGTPGRYLLLNIWANGEAARTANSIPEIQQFMAAHPASKYGATPPGIEAYHVVHRM